MIEYKSGEELSFMKKSPHSPECVSSIPLYKGEMNMLRNATNLLTKWNIRNNRKPLIVWGARQVGKTYLVKDIFAEEYYPDAYIY